ncbi:MAG: site-2 protease family protein, partial [Desulfurococcaceae archaeon]
KAVDSVQFKELYNKLLDEYHILMFQLKSYYPIIRLTNYRSGKSTLYTYRWVLTSLTIVTVFLTGFALSSGLQQVLNLSFNISDILINSALYTTVFLASLISHEIGHLAISKRTGIRSEGPILIPAPPLQLGFIGTLGAIILTKTPPCTRKDLAKLGLMGPLLGFTVSLLFGLLGVYLSPVVPPSAAERLVEEGALSPLQVASLSFYLLTLLKNEGVLVVHPVLFSSYVIHLVTFLNLLPIGQLDGGHVVRSAVGPRPFKTIGAVIPMILLTAGVALTIMGLNGIYYIGIGLITLVLYSIMGRRGHPGVANQLDESKCNICIVLYFVLLILTVPIPFA